MRRQPPHHLSPARANHPAGQDPGARLSRPSHHSNAPIKTESQSILSKIIAHFPQSLKAHHSRGNPRGYGATQQVKRAATDPTLYFVHKFLVLATADARASLFV